MNEPARPICNKWVHLIALLTTFVLCTRLFGWMWMGFPDQRYWPSVATLWLIGSISGFTCPFLGAHRALLAFTVSALCIPLLYLFIIVVGAMETFGRQNSYDSLNDNWPLLIAPVGIFLVQVIPSIICAVVGSRFKQNNHAR